MDQPLEGLFEQPPKVMELDPICIGELLSGWRETAPGFLLESGLDVSGTGVWSFWGGDPVDQHVVQVSELVCGEDSNDRTGPLRDLDRWFSKWKAPEESLFLDGHEVPFKGGAVGWIGYEALDQFHHLGEDLRPARYAPSWLKSVPALHFSLYDEIFVQHRESGKTWLLHRERTGWQQRLKKWCNTASDDDELPALDCTLQSAFSEEEYLGAVRKIQQGINDGDYYEVNLARGFLLKGISSPMDLHRRWRAVQPVPYGALIQTDDCGVVSASPEQFLCRRGGLIRTRPIKGTVPRSGDAARDREAAVELLGSEKEKAELAMIIDLERNDLGRICKPGSVKVVSEAQVESYASVLHAVATIEGELQGDLGPGKILEATFPGGSITGAPKRAAMKAIRELEPWPRSVYTGSVGWIDAGGDLEFNIAIRTAVIHGEEALIPFGGAITWDSDCEAESREIGHKARAILGAIGLDTDADSATFSLREKSG